MFKSTVNKAFKVYYGKSAGLSSEKTARAPLVEIVPENFEKRVKPLFLNKPV